MEYKKLGDIAVIARGGNFQKKDFAKTGVPCIHYGQIYTKYGLFTDKAISCVNEEVGEKLKYAEKNDIIMTITSENVEDVCKRILILLCLRYLVLEEETGQRRRKGLLTG